MVGDLPNGRQIIPPKCGWKADTMYLVRVAYSAANPVHKSYLHVGFLKSDDTPGGYSTILSDCGSTSDYPDAFYLEVVKELHSGDDYMDREEAEPSPTKGFNLGQRIAHVGGVITETSHVQFGSVMAVNALIRHVIRDGLTKEQA